MIVHLTAIFIGEKMKKDKFSASQILGLAP